MNLYIANACDLRIDHDIGLFLKKPRVLPRGKYYNHKYATHHSSR
jgi:hypothetical protein